MSKKIYLHLSGGIGNQLFQYAAAKNLSILNKADLILDKTSGFITDLKFKRKYSLDYVESKNKKSSPILFLMIFRIFKKIFFLKKKIYNFFNNKIIDEYYSFEKFHPELKNLKFEKKLYMLGLFQSEKYFHENKKKIIKKIFPKIPKNSLYINCAKQIDDKSIAICVRTFEDLPGNLHHTVGGLTDHLFFENSVKIFLNKINKPKLYFFSTNKKNVLNLINKVKLFERFEKTIITKETGFKKDIDTLWLISNFRNLIISNSTFYWWGAYFSNFKSDKTKIVTTSKFPNNDTNQKNWLII
ncbi:alpha-1,2-fucosyltransferase [Candidatus Pelagibacter sp.]|nr:alpha-1,2-fucosyltransferase [Candidatus Pelagibacter sp.]MDC1070566.1 alpha-1,2-fucosyltransferase [Candidatus Pelagibacter sp.]